MLCFTRLSRAIGPMVLLFVAATSATTASAQEIVLNQADIIGIRLGQSPDEALAKLKANDPPFEIKSNSLGVQGGGAPFTHTMYATWQSRTDGATDRINVGLTLPPARQQVFAVHRSILFAGGKELDRETVLRDLRQKYGPEMYLRKDQAYPVLQWAHDERGAPLPEQIIRQCGGWFQDGSRIGSNDQFYRPPGGGATSKLLIPCYTADFVSIAVFPASTNPALVRALEFHIESGGLLGKNMAATRAWAQQLAQQGAQKDVDTAKQRSGPKL